MKSSLPLSTVSAKCLKDEKAIWLPAAGSLQTVKLLTPGYWAPMITCFFDMMLFPMAFRRPCRRSGWRRRAGTGVHAGPIHVVAAEGRHSGLPAGHAPPEAPCPFQARGQEADAVHTGAGQCARPRDRSVGVCGPLRDGVVAGPAGSEPDVGKSRSSGRSDLMSFTSDGSCSPLARKRQGRLRKQERRGFPAR